MRERYIEKSIESKGEGRKNPLENIYFTRKPAVYVRPSVII